MGLIPLEAGLLAGAGSLVPAAGVAALWPIARRAAKKEGGHVSLRFGYVSNGLSDHRLEDALELLAENGYAGVALTLDHIHFDPLAPRLRARAARLRAELEDARARLRGGDRRAVRARPAPQALPDAAQRRPPEARRPAVHGGRRRGRARRAGRLDVVRASLPEGEARERAWDLLVDGCERVLDARRGHGVTLAFEPEPGMLVETLADYEELQERLGHPPALGLTLDIGHIVCLEPMSVTECVRRGAPTLAHVHIEDMRRGVHEHLMFGEGELDLDEALARADGDRVRRPGRRRALAPFARRARDGAGGDGARCARPRGRWWVVTLRGLSAALEARARPEGLDWLREASAAVAGDADRDPRRASRWSAARSGASRWRRTPIPPTSTRGRSTTPRARCCSSPAATAAEGELAELYRYGDAAERRGLLRALPYLELGDRGLALIDDAIRTNDTRLIARRARPVRDRAPARRRRMTRPC